MMMEEDNSNTVWDRKNWYDVEQNLIRNLETAFRNLDIKGKTKKLLLINYKVINFALAF